MIWNSWGDFFAMGGYALYVWGSMIVVALCMGGEMVAVGMRERAAREQVKALARRNGGKQ